MAANGKQTNSRWWRAPRLAFLVLALLVLLALADSGRSAVGDSLPLPSIATDKPDYAPGNAVFRFVR
jgi:hypothetical protein